MYRVWFRIDGVLVNVVCDYFDKALGKMVLTEVISKDGQITKSYIVPLGLIDKIEEVIDDAI